NLLPLCYSDPQSASFVWNMSFSLKTKLCNLHNLWILICVLCGAASAKPGPSYRFDFGPGKVAAQYKQVLAENIYSKETGFGFEPGGSVKCLDRGGTDILRSDFCTSEKPFFFS